MPWNDKCCSVWGTLCIFKFGSKVVESSSFCVPQQLCKWMPPGPKLMSRLLEDDMSQLTSFNLYDATADESDQENVLSKLLFKVRTAVSYPVPMASTSSNSATSLESLRVYLFYNFFFVKKTYLSYRIRLWWKRVVARQKRLRHFRGVQSALKRLESQYLCAYQWMSLKMVVYWPKRRRMIAITSQSWPTFRYLIIILSTEWLPNCEVKISRPMKTIPNTGCRMHSAKNVSIAMPASNFIEENTIVVSVASCLNPLSS